MQIVAKLEETSIESIKAGAWLEYNEEGSPIVWTSIGYLSATEFIILLYRIFGENPFLLEAVPFEGDLPRIDSFQMERALDIVHGD